jgi:hypothetical protein
MRRTGLSPSDSVWHTQEAEGQQAAAHPVPPLGAGPPAQDRSEAEAQPHGEQGAAREVGGQLPQQRGGRRPGCRLRGSLCGAGGSGAPRRDPFFINDGGKHGCRIALEYRTVLHLFLSPFGLCCPF